MTSSRLTDAHSGSAAPQSPHALLSGFCQSRSATWLLDRALRMQEDRPSSQTDSSLDESTDRLREGAGPQRGRGHIKEDVATKRQRTVEVVRQSDRQADRHADRQAGR